MPPAGSQPLFASRKEAGRLLAGKVASRRYLQPAVLALPGAGVVVAYEVARSLQAPLDVVVLCGQEHRLDSPACACSRVDGGLVEAEALAASRPELERERAELAEISRRELLYRGGRPGLAIAGLTSILVDDGSANAAMLRAAVRRLRNGKPRRVVLALPLVERATAREIGAEADETIHLFELAAADGPRRPYGDRGSPSDEDVADLLERAAAGEQR